MIVSAGHKVFRSAVIVLSSAFLPAILGGCGASAISHRTGPRILESGWSPAGHRWSLIVNTGAHGTCYSIAWDDPALGGGGGGCSTTLDYVLGGYALWSGDPNHDDVLIAGAVAPNVKVVEVVYAGGRQAASTYSLADGDSVRFYVLDLPFSVHLIRFSARDFKGHEIGHLDCLPDGQCSTPSLGI